MWLECLAEFRGIGLDTVSCAMCWARAGLGSSLRRTRFSGDLNNEDVVTTERNWHEQKFRDTGPVGEDTPMLDLRGRQREPRKAGEAEL